MCIWPLITLVVLFRPPLSMQTVNQKRVLVRALAFLVSRGGNPAIRAGKVIVQSAAGRYSGAY